MENSKSVCIIGAGLSGLTCAVKLLRAGYKVSIVEEMTYPGGLLASTRIGKEYLELLPHHLRKSDKALLSLAKDMGVSDRIEWYDSIWYGKAAKKKVGYFDAGFSVLINSLLQEVTDKGGQIFYSTTVYDIVINGEDEPCKYTTNCILTNSSHLLIKSDYVIYTGSCRAFVNVSHSLPMNIDMRDNLMNVTYKARITLLLNLKKLPSEVFIQKFNKNNDESLLRIVNHTNCFGMRDYGGHIVYLVGSCHVSDNIWVQSDSDIMENYFSQFRKLYPSLRKSDIKAWRLTKTRYAISDNYPSTDLTNPVDGIYLCAASLTQATGNYEVVTKMDNVVTLANNITERIISNDKNKAALDGDIEPNITPISIG